ncbi:hypothetical protein RUM43_002816 [Polyplax serrata]|uniref:Uncharacterized protein n=1 Tax=Polyplax serrata TaxID=468196 RepID=A0AAN8NZA4_POLSC
MTQTASHPLSFHFFNGDSLKCRKRFLRCDRCRISYAECYPSSERKRTLESNEELANETGQRIYQKLKKKLQILDLQNWKYDFYYSQLKKSAICKPQITET